MLSVPEVPSARAPKPPLAPLPPGGDPWPALGLPSLAPGEPVDSFNAALGAHLEQLGGALRARASQPPQPPPPGSGPEAVQRRKGRKHSDPLGKQPEAENVLTELFSSFSREENVQFQEVCPLAAKWRSPANFFSDPPTRVLRQTSPQLDGGERKKMAKAVSFHEVLDPVTESSSLDDSKMEAGVDADQVDSKLSDESEGDDKPKKKSSIDSSIFLVADKSRRVSNRPDTSMPISDIRAALSEANSTPTTRLGMFVTHTYFEFVFGVLTVANTAVMILEEQLMGAKAGFEVGYYQHYGSPAQNETYHGFLNEESFTSFEIVFAIVFSVEALLRILGRGRRYWTDRYELLDLTAVVGSLVSIVMQNSNTTNLQVLRLLRCAKALRLLKLVRAFRGVDSLQLMTTALAASGFALLWASLLLFIMQSIVALILTSLFRSMYLEVPGCLDNPDRIELFQYFGTYTRSMLSLFELTLANWPPISRFLTESLHEGWMLFAIAYKLSFGFAVVGVINAVFVQETFNVASTDDSIMVKKKLRAASTHRKKMQILFRKLDATGRGTVNRKDFERVLQDPSIGIWLEAMDLDASDANVLFALLDRDGDKTISVEELCSGAARLKGQARSFDVQMALQALKERWVQEVVPEAERQRFAASFTRTVSSECLM